MLKQQQEEKKERTGQRFERYKMEMESSKTNSSSSSVSSTSSSSSSSSSSYQNISRTTRDDIAVEKTTTNKVPNRDQNMWLLLQQVQDEEGSNPSASYKSSLSVPSNNNGRRRRRDRSSPAPQREEDDDDNKIDPSSRKESLKFNPNEKGTKKQKRCDYDSDRSYEGLGLEYQRSKLLTPGKKDTFLPYTNRWNCPVKLDMMVDFDKQATKTSWGDRLLFESLRNEDVDDLVGLATTFGSDTNTSQSQPATGAPPVFQDPQKHNPLLLLQNDSPLPPSYIDYIKSRALQQLRQNDCNIKNYKKNNLESFDTSAAVAMGMYLEECITASLLPLAGLHVVRCRAIENMTLAETEFGTMSAPTTSSNNNINDDDDDDDDDDDNPICNVYNVDDDDSYALKQTVLHPITGEKVHLDMNKIQWKDEKSFEEWTLPPEEAILKLREQEMLSKETSYHFVPEASRSWNCPIPDETNDSLNTAERDQSSTFAVRHNVNPSAVVANWEIFDIFMTQANALVAQQQQQQPPPPPQNTTTE